MKKITGFLFILGALGVFIPYTILTITFDYPDILRSDPGEILVKFREGGQSLIFTWWLFAVLGLPMVIANVQLGKALEDKSPAVRWITVFGVMGLFVQMIGLLRWAFVVPILSEQYFIGDTLDKEIAISLFRVIHQYGGVVLGEHLGQLFTIIWVMGISFILDAQKLVKPWMTVLGFGSSAIYLLAQAELFATVIPGFPVWGLAGFLGSTLWLIWLIALGILLIFSLKIKE